MPSKSTIIGLPYPTPLNSTDMLDWIERMGASLTHKNWGDKRLDQWEIEWWNPSHRKVTGTTAAKAIAAAMKAGE